MSSDRGQYSDEVYHHEDDPYDESPAEAREDESPVPYFPAAPWGLWPFSRRGADQTAEYDETDDRPYDEQTYREDTGDRHGLSRLWDEGLITLLIVGGAILFLFPEPATSGLGVLLMGIGVLAWLFDWAT